MVHNGPEVPLAYSPRSTLETSHFFIPTQGLSLLGVTSCMPVYDGYRQAPCSITLRFPYLSSLLLRGVRNGRLQRNLATACLWCPRDEAVNDSHALRRCRRGQLCPRTFSEEYGAGKTHLNAAEVDTEALPGPVPKGVERQLGLLGEPRSRKPAGVVKAEKGVSRQHRAIHRRERWMH